VADKTTNINIKYNVDVSGVARAEAASRAAQKATDELRKVTEQYGKAAVEAAKTASDSLKKTSSDVNSLTKEFNGLYTSVKAILTAGIAKEFLDLSLNMARLSGQVEGVTLAFNKLPNATLLLNDLRKATHGTVTDLQLMQRALSANNFRIPLEQLGKLLEFASVKAQQTGQEVNHLVDYIVSGIGYRSIKRLDDLGFTANRVKEALGGVSLQAASMGQVMDAVTKLMDEDLQKTGGYADTAATKVGNIERKWQKLKETTSEYLTSPDLLNFYEKFLDSFTTGLNFIIGGTKKIQEEQSKAAAIREVEGFKEMYLTQEILKNRQAAADIVQQEANTRQQLIGRNNDELARLRTERTEITDSGRFMTRQEAAQVEEINKQIKYYNQKNIVLKESVKILKDYSRSLYQVSTNEGGGEAVDRSLVTDPVAFFKIPEKTIDKKSLDQSRGLLEEQIKDILKQMQDVADRIPVLVPIKPAPPSYEDSEWTKAFERNREAILNSSLEGTNLLIQSELQREVDAYSQRINMLKDFYHEQIELAGDNQQKKNELRIKEDREIRDLEKKRADREKKAALAGIVVNTALGVVKAFATAATVYDGAIQAAIVAAQGATEYAAASRARYYAKGEINIKGPGTETSDSIPAMLSKGESVMTAKQTRESFGILTDVRAGKMNDKILKQIVNNGGAQASIDDSRIVKELVAIRKNQTDFEKVGSILYKTKMDSHGNKQRIRSRSI
jgi:hypothetical protein